MVGMCGTSVTAHTQGRLGRLHGIGADGMSLQARKVKTVKVRITSADGGCGSDRRLPLGESPLALLRGGDGLIRLVSVIAIDWVTFRLSYCLTRM